MTNQEIERMEELEDAMYRANADIATHWQVRGEQMEQIVRLRELLAYVAAEIVQPILNHGVCECDPTSGDNPCEYCAAKHFAHAIDLNSRIKAKEEKNETGT